MQTVPVAGNEALVRMALKEPVALTLGTEEVAFVLSKPDYERLTRHNLDRLNKICEKASAEAAANGLTEEILNQILADES